MYAIVKTGGKQYKVAVDDVVTVEKIDGAPGDEISLVPVLLVDGDDLTTAAEATLIYWRFTDIEPDFDSGSVAVLDASNDTVIATIAMGIDGLSAAWTEIRQPLPPAALGKTIKIEFRLQSDDFEDELAFDGFYVDDVQVTVR